MEAPAVSKASTYYQALSVHSRIDPIKRQKKPVQEITSYITRYTESTKMYTHSNLS